MTRRARPLLVYDGDCGFCTASIRFAERRITTDARAVPFQFADLDGLGVRRARAEREVLWIGRDGHVSGGVQAIARLLIEAGWPWLPLGLVARVPPFRWIGHWIYRLIAVNRQRMPGGTATCALPAAARGRD